MLSKPVLLGAVGKPGQPNLRGYSGRHGCLQLVKDHGDFEGIHYQTQKKQLLFSARFATCGVTARPSHSHLTLPSKPPSTHLTSHANTATATR
jgi:hypothetical protein